MAIADFARTTAIPSQVDNPGFGCTTLVEFGFEVGIDCRIAESHSIQYRHAAWTILVLEAAMSHGL